VGLAVSSRPPHRCELHSGPDDRGRYHYSLSWMADWPANVAHAAGWDYRWHERWQHFFGVPPDDVPQVDRRPGRASA
jgi:hypothetical protein